MIEAGSSTGDAVKQEIAAAYSDNELTDEQLNVLVGADETANFRGLKQQLTDDSIDGIVET